MLIDSLDTPAVIVDLDVMERNMTRMAEYCRSHQIALRPHTKTHKIPELARKQIESGAKGITVAKLGEAEIMADHGINDILIAYPIVGIEKAKRLSRLAERVQLTVSLDSVESAEEISRQAQAAQVQIAVLIELDVGFKRCGLANEHAALALARKISSLPGLVFTGLMFYPGHFLIVPPEQLKLLDGVNSQLRRTYELFLKEGLEVQTVSGGSTPSAYISHLFAGVNEIRPGMYLFNDRNLLGARVAALEECALSVLSTVVSIAVPGKAIVDGGTKTFSSDPHLSGKGLGFGFVREDPQAEVVALNEEHGHLDISRSSHSYRVGNRLTIIPNHVCATINMHDEIYGVRRGEVENVWTVMARGKVK